MSLRRQVSSDHQLARLLQIGIVLEEVNEERARRHREEHAADEALQTVLATASDQSATHRDQLESLLSQLDGETVPSASVRDLVDEHYAGTRPEDFDDVLYDQLCSEESAYKFYDDLIGAIESSDVTYSIDREALLTELTAIRAEEAAGAQEIVDLLEERP